MNKLEDYDSYPLSASLTRRVVNYLNIYRMVIAILLGVAHFGDLKQRPGLHWPMRSLSHT
jgi:hypothetical protein